MKLQELRFCPLFCEFEVEIIMPLNLSLEKKKLELKEIILKN